MPVIALVDDDSNILASVSIVLEAEGYEIRHYMDGVAALHGIQASPPDSAILFIDYIIAEREVLELLLRIPQDSVKSEDHRIAEEVRDKMVAAG